MEKYYFNLQNVCLLNDYPISSIVHPSNRFCNIVRYKDGKADNIPAFDPTAD